jgi:hypothetical protein
LKTVVQIGDIAWQGKTEPVFCRADDGHEYVVKGSFAGRRALIAEWVANRLGKLLGLPIPDFAQLRLDPMLVQYSAKIREIERLGRGVLFGSRREPSVVEIRQTDLARLDLALKARVLAFDWWIANSDRVFTGGAGNPNLLWAEDQQRLVVIDHNLAFDPSLMEGFWAEHAFRDARDLWSGALRDELSAKFRAALTHLQAIWNELPEDWTEVESGLSLATIESLLWKFDLEPDIFWGGL